MLENILLKDFSLPSNSVTASMIALLHFPQFISTLISTFCSKTTTKRWNHSVSGFEKTSTMMFSVYLNSHDDGLAKERERSGLMEILENEEVREEWF